MQLLDSAPFTLLTESRKKHISWENSWHGASFLNRAHCTVITYLDTSKRSTQKAFSCRGAILETVPAVSMRSLDSCRCWRCTFCPCKVRNKFLVNFWNHHSFVNTLYLLGTLLRFCLFVRLIMNIYFLFIWTASSPYLGSCDTAHEGIRRISKFRSIHPVPSASNLSLSSAGVATCWRSGRTDGTPLMNSLNVRHKNVKNLGCWWSEAFELSLCLSVCLSICVCVCERETSGGVRYVDIL